MRIRSTAICIELAFASALLWAPARSLPAIQDDGSQLNDDSRQTDDSQQANRQDCLAALRHAKLPLQKLRKHWSPGFQPLKSNPWTEVLRMNEKNCYLPIGRAQLLRKLQAFQPLKQGKVAFFRNERRPQSDLILAGVKSALTDQDQKVLEIVEIPHNHPHPDTFMAEAFFRHNFMIIAADLTDTHTNVLSNFAHQLKVPMLLFKGTVAEAKPASPGYVFRVFPDAKVLVHGLIRQAKIESLRRVAIFRPNRASAISFAGLMKHELANQGMEFVEELVYDGAQFESIEAAAMQLFRLRPSDRRSEWYAAHERLKRRAANEGVPFNARMVYLKPLDRIDMVFVPDDFRSVRHIAKVFRFLGVENVKLYGHHEWRSRSLILPYDDFLDKAVFSDFIGDYRKLPTQLFSRPPNDLFLQSGDIENLDYRLMGYLAGLAIKGLLEVPPTTSEQAIATLKSLTFPPNLSGFASGRLFQQDQSMQWPSYLFRISRGNLSILGQSSAGLKTASPLQKPP